MDEVPTLAFIGGSGLYNFSAISDQESVDIETPFGFPSSPIIIGNLVGRKVAFLARHGIGHFIPPGDVNYRANIYALKSLGVQNIISISACGSLREDYKPGDIVIPDQLFDFTRDRKRSFFEQGLVVHIGTADPYCENLSNHVLMLSIKRVPVFIKGVLLSLLRVLVSPPGLNRIYSESGVCLLLV